MTTQEQVRDAWDNIATGYDQFATPLARSLAEDVLGRVGLRPGERLLDVAAGTGALSLPAARLGAQVSATDIAPAMIKGLDARAEGLTNIEGRVMDGHTLELEDDTFDVSASQLGVSLFPDLKRGLRELVRVTKPGGRVLIVAFGPPQKAEFFGFFLAAIQAVVPDFTGPPMDPPPLQFQVADPEKLRQEMTGAGLDDVQVETATWGMEFRSATHYWNLVTNSNPMGPALVGNLTQAQQTDVKKVLDGMLRDRSGGDAPAVLNAEINVGIGAKSRIKGRKQ
jgi:ubiquinone/menaquinone biosynthesis C-methylase UbiE